MAISRKGRLGSRGWKIDYDYIGKLTDKEKEFLNSFTEETYLANFNHDGKKIHKTKAKQRDIYRNNNASNRCTMSLAGSKTIRADAANGVMEVMFDLTQVVNPSAYEDAIIEVLDTHAATAAFPKSQEPQE